MMSGSAHSKFFRRILLCGMAPLALASCAPEAPSEPVSSASETAYTTEDLRDILSDPVQRSNLIAKVVGSAEEDTTTAFLRFHVYGYAGENVIPFFSMNNVIVQNWEPQEEPGYYSVQHYEVAYFSEFDTAEPIETWTNPITGEVVEIPPLILGPIGREYTPEGVIAPGMAPDPLSVSVIGDRVFIPTQSIEKFFNPMSTPDWGPYQGPPDIYWDTMMTFSADVETVLDPSVSRAKAEIHMQNMVSYAPFLKMGTGNGRTMVRAFGVHIDSLDDIPPEYRAGLEAHTPEIFNTEDWQDLRIDSIDFMNEVRVKLDSGEIPVSEQ